MYDKSQPLGNFCQLESMFFNFFGLGLCERPMYSILPYHFEYANWLTEICHEARIFENINKCHNIEQNLSGLHAFKTLL